MSEVIRQFKPVVHRFRKAFDSRFSSVARVVGWLNRAAIARRSVWDRAGRARFHRRTEGDQIDLDTTQTSQRQRLASAGGRHRPRHYFSGYSLLELMITVALIGVLAGMVGNGIGNWLQRRLYQADVQAILSQLYRVRSESIMRAEYNQVDIDNHKLDFTMRYGDAVGSAGSGVLDLSDEIRILEANSNMAAMLVILYTHKGHLSSNATQFRVCSNALNGEQPTLFTINSSGRVAHQQGGQACP